MAKIFVCWKHPHIQHFWLLPELKSAMKEQGFQNTEDIQKNVMAVLKVILTREFHKRFHLWQHCQVNYIASQGDYFEGDLSHLTSNTQEHLH
jgi:hypothetical protein